MARQMRNDITSNSKEGNLVNEIKNLLTAVINTLRTIKTDNVEGNWNKLVGCEDALRKVMAQLPEEIKLEEGGTEDGNI